MPNQMNEAYWTAKKAKTLLDSGDTVKKCLKNWDTLKNIKKRMSPDEFKPVIAALALVKKYSEDLMKKANSVVHKETIALLKLYVDLSKQAIAKLEAAKGKELLTNFLNLPKPVMEDLKKMNPALWDRHSEHLEFMQAMKSSGGKGTQKIFDTWIKIGAKFQVNVADALLLECKKAIDLKPKPALDAPCWKKVLDGVTLLMKNQAASGGTKTDCETLDKCKVLEVLRNL